MLGDTTYNHVYGTSATGDITNAMKGSTAGRPAWHGGIPAVCALAAGCCVQPGACWCAVGVTGCAPLGTASVAPRLPALSLLPPAADATNQQQQRGVMTRRMSSIAASFSVPMLPPVGESSAAGHHQPAAAPTEQLLQRPSAPGAPAAATAAMPAPTATAMPLAQPISLQRPHTTPHMVENTIKLLEDDITDAWRLGYAPQAAGLARASVASNRVAPAHRRYGETTALLGGTTQLLNTGNMTVQLLADTTTNHRAAMEQFLGVLPTERQAKAVRWVRGQREKKRCLHTSTCDDHMLEHTPLLAGRQAHVDCMCI